MEGRRSSFASTRGSGVRRAVAVMAGKAKKGSGFDGPTSVRCRPRPAIAPEPKCWVDDARASPRLPTTERLVNGQARQDLWLFRAHDRHAGHCGPRTSERKNMRPVTCWGNTEALCYARATSPACSGSRTVGRSHCVVTSHAHSELARVGVIEVSPGLVRHCVHTVGLCIAGPPPARSCVRGGGRRSAHQPPGEKMTASAPDRTASELWAQKPRTVIAMRFSGSCRCGRSERSTVRTWDRRSGPSWALFRAGLRRRRRGRAGRFLVLQLRLLILHRRDDARGRWVIRTARRSR